MDIKEKYNDKWSKISDENITNKIYQKRFRLQLPDGGEKLVESNEELHHYLELFYGCTNQS